jgi:hypothetical protein
VPPAPVRSPDRHCPEASSLAPFFEVPCCHITCNLALPWTSSTLPADKPCPGHLRILATASCNGGSAKIAYPPCVPSSPPLSPLSLLFFVLGVMIPLRLYVARPTCLVPMASTTSFGLFCLVVRAMILALLRVSPARLGICLSFGVLFCTISCSFAPGFRFHCTFSGGHCPLFASGHRELRSILQ